MDGLFVTITRKKAVFLCSENILADSMSKVYLKCFEGTESATISQQDIQVEDYRMNWSKRPL